ncbi:hypothetical protein LTR36_007942 [Oleoguttula mirabilis]|uniref:ZZ-type domain-containing protein n=1 Tax=Oleoguttula mirabilis TaxID=1507867 RepID=A0AAV9J8S5_9PEZI|nr:hypothetical protein LTR36_007942 [Oleoguttula mirabilis]
MADQQVLRAKTRYRCYSCNAFSGGEVRYSCLACDNIDFCEKCFAAARQSGKHAKHGVFRLGPVTQRQKQTAQAAVQAFSDGKTATTEHHGTDVSVPQSLHHLERAQLYYGHGNTHTTEEDSPYVAQIILIMAFKTAHYAADIRAASGWQLRDLQGTTTTTGILENINAQVPSGSHVKLSHHWEGKPVAKVASLADRKDLAPRLAAEEISKAVEATEEEGGGGVALAGLRELAGKLGVELELNGVAAAGG